jgi:hypothetical protein
MQDRPKELKHISILGDSSTAKEAVEASGIVCNRECNTLEGKRTQTTMQNETVEALLNMANAGSKFQSPLSMPTTDITVSLVEGK